MSSLHHSSMATQKARSTAALAEAAANMSREHRVILMEICKRSLTIPFTFNSWLKAVLNNFINFKPLTLDYFWGALNWNKTLTQNNEMCEKKQLPSYSKNRQ